MQAVLSSTDQLALPAELRHQDNIQAGDKFEIQRIHAGEYVLKRRTKTVNNVGLVDLLLSCPEKGWFEPIEPESTDTL